MMRCEQFASRLDELLDARADPAGDASLREHAHVCTACARTLEQWRRVQHSLGVAIHPALRKIAESKAAKPKAAESKTAAVVRQRDRRSVSAAAFALAALWLVAVSLHSERSPVLDRGTPEPIAMQSPLPPLDLHLIGTRIHEPEWWGSMMVAAWKPVDPLADSIQPITDSFQTALELLAPRRPPDDSPPRTSIDNSSARRHASPTSIA